jgi:hypothetical protein
MSSLYTRYWRKNTFKWCTGRPQSRFNLRRRCIWLKNGFLHWWAWENGPQICWRPITGSKSRLWDLKEHFLGSRPRQLLLFRDFCEATKLTWSKSGARSYLTTRMTNLSRNSKLNFCKNESIHKFISRTDGVGTGLEFSLNFLNSNKIPRASLTSPPCLFSKCNF